ncbi:hypothetical protein SRHO_G00103270 [Serrasalmus rhombeus]
MGNENSRSGGATDPNRERGEPSRVPMKSDGSTPVPSSFNRGGEQPSEEEKRSAVCLRRVMVPWKIFLITTVELSLLVLDTLWWKALDTYNRVLI